MGETQGSGGPLRPRTLTLLLSLSCGACALNDQAPPPAEGPAANASADLQELARQATTLQEASARVAGLAAELREGGRPPEELLPLIEASAEEARAAHAAAQEAVQRASAHLLVFPPEESEGAAATEN